MIAIDAAVIEFVEGGKAIWVQSAEGCVLRIQCTGAVKVHSGCENNCPHADINVQGDITICIPDEKR